MDSCRTCLVIPCHNEEKRLDLDACARHAGDIRFVFVNDGSSDRTGEMLRRRADEKNIFALDLPVNHGKSEAVRQGMLFAVGLPDAADFRWYGYWDADLATPISEVENFRRYADVFDPGAEAVFGSRVRRLGSSISRSPVRYVISRIFMNLFNLFFGLHAYDTQCGAKLFRREVVETAFLSPFVTKWIFDVEVCLRLHGRSVLEYPLFKWDEISGSKVSSLKAARGIVVDVFKLWSCLRRRARG